MFYQRTYARIFVHDMSGMLDICATKLRSLL